MTTRKLLSGSFSTHDELVHPDEEALSRSARIFINRNLKMKNTQVIGFDMDHTLAIYHKVPIETLAFDETKRIMVNEMGYPKEILKLRYDPDFVIRGLVVDKVRGNIIKMDRHKYVVTAYHGKRRLSREERKATYANKKVLIQDKDFRSIDTQFSLPEGDLFAQIIDLIELEHVQVPKTMLEMFDDIRSCIDKAHRDSTMKSKITASPERFFLKDPRLALTLDKFVRGGKKLFLLTNSGYDYTDKVMGHLLNGELEDYPTWRDYFEYIIVDASKPDFFYDGAPLEQLTLPPDLENGDGPRVIYRRGNAAQLEDLTGIRGEEILYVGDHTYGDILRSKKNSLWRTAMVIEELEKELAAADHVKDLYRELDHLHAETKDLRLRANLLVERLSVIQETKMQDYRAIEEEGYKKLDQECYNIWRKVTRIEVKLSEQLSKMKALEIEVDKAFNPYWGQLFNAGRETSRFADQVKDYACVYTCRVSNFLHYPTNKYYQTDRQLMPHEL